MKKQALLFALALTLGGAVAFSTGAPAPDAANAAGNGKGGGGAGGDGEIPDYGDLIILHRDEFGVPIPSDPVLVPDASTEDPNDEIWGGLCWQPLAAPIPDDSEDPFTNWVRPNPDDPDNPDDRVVYPTGKVVVDEAGRWLIPVDQYNCAVETVSENFATYTEEVDFGRINQARSPVTVFESQLEDVVVKLATAYSTSLDPAGRMVASTCGVDEVTDGNILVPSTIDSPLQNLAIYRQLMLTGTIGPALPEGAGAVETAARGLGVASDKGGEVNVDMVAYLNQVMGLTDPATSTILPKLSETYREEVQGVIQPVTKYFLDYSANGYAYNRAENFGALPSTGHIGNGQGEFEYLSVVVPETTPPLFEIVRGPIMGAVPFTDVPGSAASNIGAFAQAADDTRAVINFMHDWPMPDADVYGTPLGSCDPGTAGTSYDVSISDVSGLQVPKNIVDGSSDREFIVTVANAGPDAATVTLTVTATPVIEGIVEANLGTEFIAGPFVFAPVGIPAGTSHAFSALIHVDIGEPTTIDWMATAIADDDVNLSNNTVTAVSTVRATGSGGGGGRP